MSADDALDVRQRRQTRHLDDAHGAEDAHVAHVRQGARGGQPLRELPFDARHLRGVVAGDEEVQRRTGRRAGEGIGHVGGAVHECARRTGGNRVRHLLRGERGGERQMAARERLADGHDVGRDARARVRPAGARPVAAGGDFVEDEQDAVFVAEAAHFAQVGGMVEVHRVRGLEDGLADERGNLVRVFLHDPAQRGGVGGIPRRVGRDARLFGEEVPRHDAPEERVHAVRVRERHAERRVAVVAALQGEEPIPLGAPPRVLVLDGHLRRDLDGNRT